MLMASCPNCGGDKGFEVLTHYDPRDGSPCGYIQECRHCAGTGEVPTEPIDLQDLEQQDDDGCLDALVKEAA